MAITTKTRLGVLGITVLPVAAVWFYFATQKLAIHYKETNASWRIQGLCTNAQDGTPIKGADVTAYFSEPIARRHKWRNPSPLATTEVVTKADDQGRFEVVGEGGSVYINVQAKGYRVPEPWENWSYYTKDGVTRVDTNMVLGLTPVSSSEPHASGKPTD